MKYKSVIIEELSKFEKQKAAVIGVGSGLLTFFGVKMITDTIVKFGTGIRNMKESVMTVIGLRDDGKLDEYEQKVKQLTSEINMKSNNINKVLANMRSSYDKHLEWLKHRYEKVEDEITRLKINRTIDAEFETKLKEKNALLASLQQQFFSKKTIYDEKIESKFNEHVIEINKEKLQLEQVSSALNSHKELMTKTAKAATENLQNEINGYLSAGTAFATFLGISIGFIAGKSAYNKYNNK